MIDGNGYPVSHLFLRGRQFDINHDGLVGKSMVMINYSDPNKTTLKNDDGSVANAYPYSPQGDTTQTVKVIAFRIGSANDSFPGLWLKGNIETPYNPTGALYWIEAKLITIL